MKGSGALRAPSAEFSLNPKALNSKTLNLRRTPQTVILTVKDTSEPLLYSYHAPTTGWGSS